MVGGAIGLAVFGTIAWTVVANSVRAGAVHATTAADRAGRAARPSLAGLTAIYHYALAAGFSRALLAADAAMLLALAITVVTIQIDNHSPQRMNHETHDHRGHRRNRTGTASAGRRSGIRRHRPPACSASSRSAPRRSAPSPSRSRPSPPKHDPGDGFFMRRLFTPRGKCHVRQGLCRPRADGRHPRRQPPGLDRRPAATAHRRGRAQVEAGSVTAAPGSSSSSTRPMASCLTSPPIPPSPRRRSRTRPDWSPASPHAA
jgi:hypothetical protein